VLFALAIAPLLANMLPDLRAEGDFLTSGGGFADIFSADLAGYVVPTQLHPLLGGVIRAWSHDSTPQPDGSYFAVNKGQQIYLGYVALALAIVGAWRGRRRGETWFWVTSALLFFVLTLGPNLRIAGHDTGIPLPFRLLEQLPFFKGNRYPSRYSVMLLLSVAPLVAAGSYCVLRIAYSVDDVQTGRRSTLHASRFTSPRLLVYLSSNTSRLRCRFPTSGCPRSTRAWRPSRVILRCWSCRRAGATAHGWPGSKTSSS
jgi:hypothetical protein